MNGIRMAGFVLILSGFTVFGVEAQEPRTGAFVPYLGCWSPEGGEEGPDLCLEGEDGLGFRAEYRFPGAPPVASEAISIGDRVRVTKEACSGFEENSFSADGRRIFLRFDAVCAGGVRRIETGMLALTPEGVLLELRAVEIDGETVPWVRRYVPQATVAFSRPGGNALEVARRSAGRLPDLDDLIEASHRVAPPVVEAWLVETEVSFRLDARVLLRLSDAGVPASVLDVAIALSHPGRFALERSERLGVEVERTVEPERSSRGWPAPPPGRGGWGWTPMGWHRWHPGASVWSWEWRTYRYQPAGYGRWDRHRRPWDSWGGGVWVPPVIIVGPPSGPPDPGARVVRGRGYTRPGSSGEGRSSDPDPPSRSGSGSSGSATSGSTGSASEGGGGSQGGSAEPVRTAKPRPPGAP